MASLKSKLKKGAMALGAAMLVATYANKEAKTDNSQQDTEPTKIENVVVRHGNTDTGAQDITALKKQIAELNELQQYLVARAATEYWNRLDKKYPASKFLSADEMEYFSALAKKIQKNPKSIVVPTNDFEFAIVGKYGDFDKRRLMNVAKISVMESVDRIAAGRESMRDLEVMIIHTDFNSILNNEELKELGNYITFSSVLSLDNVDNGGVKAEWARQRFEYLQANINFASNVDEMLAVTPTDQHNLDSVVASLQQRRVDILKASGYTGTEDFVQPGPNFQIPEMQKIRKEYDVVQQEINKLQQKYDTAQQMMHSIHMQKDR